MTDPNYKFRAIAEDAERVALLAGEISGLFHEATVDGITAWREIAIKNRTRQVEAGMRRLRQHVQTYKPEIVSKCESCGNTVWRDD